MPPPNLGRKEGLLSSPLTLFAFIPTLQSEGLLMTGKRIVSHSRTGLSRHREANLAYSTPLQAKATTSKFSPHSSPLLE
jgi:hypothetical protein